MKSTSITEFKAMTAPSRREAGEISEDRLRSTIQEANFGKNSETSFGGKGDVSCDTAEASFEAAVRRQRRKRWL